MQKNIYLDIVKNINEDLCQTLHEIVVPTNNEEIVTIIMLISKFFSRVAIDIEAIGGIELQDIKDMFIESFDVYIEIYKSKNVIKPNPISR